jgi:hypothetical protein
MRNAEVSFTRLTSADKRLFDFAKQKEVKQFLKEEAVRRCKDEAENQEGWRSGRIMKARWVLTWKAAPAEEQAESRAEAQANRGATNLSMDGKRKAEARIVIVGFQHPDLGSSRYKTAAPEMSTMGRMLVYQLIVPNGWDIEGLDMLTAFLQTKSHQEEEQLWTTGAPELRQALGCSDEDLLQIVKNLYGLTTAPRALWEDINRACVSHEGHPSLVISVSGPGMSETRSRRMSTIGSSSLGFVAATSMTSSGLETTGILAGPRLAMISARPISGEPSEQVNSDLLERISASSRTRRSNLTRASTSRRLKT